jgi:hypothetical protein
MDPGALRVSEPRVPVKPSTVMLLRLATVMSPPPCTVPAAFSATLLPESVLVPPPVVICPLLLSCPPALRLTASLQHAAVIDVAAAADGQGPACRHGGPAGKRVRQLQR